MDNTFFLNDEETKNWDTFLENIAKRVDDIIIEPTNLEIFQERITPFGKRWTEHVDAVDSVPKERIEHWQKVIADLSLQNKNAKPPQEDWVWDKWYGFDLGVAQELQREIRSPFLGEVIRIVKGTTEGRNIERLIESNPQYQEFVECAQKMKDQWARLCVDVSGLSPIDRTTLWIKHFGIAATTNEKREQQAQWLFRLLIAEPYFGCWRPPYTIPEDPCERLIAPQVNGPLSWFSEQSERKLPPPRDRTEEYERYYVSLASIHDNMLSGVGNITKGVWPERLREGVWNILKRLRGPNHVFMETALKRVTVELDDSRPRSGPGEAGGPADGDLRTSAGDARAKTVREVRKSLMAWRVAVTTPNEANSPEARRIGGQAMRVLFRSIAILREVATVFGANPVTTSILGSPSLALDHLSDEDLEEKGTSGFYGSICKAELIADLHRWEERANGPGQPSETPKELEEADPAEAPEPTRDGHNYCPMALSKKEIGVAFGLPADNDAEKLNALCQTTGIFLRKHNRSRYFVALDTLPGTYLERLKKHLHDHHSADL